MLRFLLPLALISIILGLAGYFILPSKPSPAALATTTTTDSSSPPNSPQPIPPYPSTTPLPATASDNEKILDSKIALLQQTVNSLTIQVNALRQQTSAGESASPSPTSSPNSQPPVYISLGASALANPQSYTPLPGFLAALNSADFPGATSVILEASFSRVQPGGTAYLQLYNQTTNQAITASTISTTSTNYTLVSSSPFQLSSGTNTYALMIQSPDNTNVQVASARLKISF